MACFRYYALVEQIGQSVLPDALTLAKLEPGDDEPGAADAGGVVTRAPPRASISERISEAMILAAKRRQMVIRHSSDDRIVALLELVSPGNKEKRSAVEDFVDKAVATIEQEYHLLVLEA
jgi:hypothetical protein